jgi:Holliday junction resolvase RusA-like endonuclease
MSVTFTIPGKPFAKQRPRATKEGRVYTPKETASFEAKVGQIAAQHFPQPLDGPVSVFIWATFQPPQSWSQKKTREHIGRPHTQRPDLDNCAKAILDGLNRIAWADDGQVSELHVRKIWGNAAQTVVTVEAAA